MHGNLSNYSKLYHVKINLQIIPKLFIFSWTRVIISYWDLQPITIGCRTVQVAVCVENRCQAPHSYATKDMLSWGGQMEAV